MNSVVYAKLMEMLATLAGYAFVVLIGLVGKKLSDVLAHSKATGATKEVQDILVEAVKWGVQSAQQTDWAGEEKKKYVVQQAINFLQASPFKGDPEKYRHNIEDIVEYVLAGVKEAQKDENVKASDNTKVIANDNDGMPQSLPVEDNIQDPINADASDSTTTTAVAQPSGTTTATSSTKQ